MEVDNVIKSRLYRPLNLVLNCRFLNGEYIENEDK